MQAQSRRNSRCPWSREDGLLAPLLPLSKHSEHSPAVKRPLPFPKGWGPTEPSWSSEPVIQLCRSPRDIVTLLVASSLVLLRPLVVLPTVQPLESENPHLRRRETLPASVLRASGTSCTLNFAIVIIMSSICSSSESDEYKPDLPFVRALCSTTSTGNSKDTVGLQLQFRSTSLVVRTRLGTFLVTKGRTHRGPCRSSLTMPPRFCTSLPLSDSRTRVRSVPITFRALRSKQDMQLFADLQPFVGLPLFAHLAANTVTAAHDSIPL